MRIGRKLAGPAAAALAIAACAFTVSGCSHAQPSLAQCAIVTGHGFGSNGQQVTSIAHPGDSITIGNSDTAWYVPCDARNYVTAATGGDRSTPESVRTGGAGSQPGMPVQVWTAVYWQLNQNNNALKAFLPFCLKYGCASQTEQTSSSGQYDPHFSTAGWNGMLAENFGPALDRATQDAIGQFGPTLWTDHAAWTKLGAAIAGDFNTEIQKATGSSIPFFCGDASTMKNCAPVQVVVNNVTPTDPQVANEYDQEIEAQNALAANQARLKAAQEIYGSLAPYFLGLQDTIRSCDQTPGCAIYVGNPGTLPAK